MASEITERYQKRLSRTAIQGGQSGREEAQKEGIGERGDEGRKTRDEPGFQIPAGRRVDAKCVAS